MKPEDIIKCADAFNAMLRNEIGSETYDTLRRSDPALVGPHDHCDANMVLMTAVQHVMECGGDIAFYICTEFGDHIQEWSEIRRTLFEADPYRT